MNVLSLKKKINIQKTQKKTQTLLTMHPMLHMTIFLSDAKSSQTDTQSNLEVQFSSTVINKKFSIFNVNTICGMY